MEHINEWNIFKKEEKLYKFISVYDRMKYKKKREDYSKYELDKIAKAFKNPLSIWPSKLDVFQSNIKLNYLEYDIDIDKYEDEYYIIQFDNVDGRSNYLCDSLDGLLQAIKDNK